MKKSKYAAIALASTLALSTVVTAAPQAFDNNGITAQAAETDASTVKESIKELDVTATDYGTKVEAAKTAYDALDAAGKKKVSNAKLLNAHVAIKGNTTLTDAITALPKADNTKFTDATLSYSVDSSNSAVKLVDAKDSKGNVLKDKKGVTIQRAVNDDVETEVAKLTTFQTAYAAMIANKDTKAPLAKVYKQYQAALKVATKQQQNINAKYQASSFVHAHDVLTGATGAADYKVPVATIKGSKGKFKIDGDQYIIVAADGGYNVTDPTGATEKVTDGGSFKVINNDTDDSKASSDNSTLYDEYKVSTANGAIVLEKVEETIAAAKGAANVLALDKSMAPSAYKALKAGTTKYSDQQIEMINALNNEYKKLNSSAKKVLSEDQVAKMKEYTAALKVQQALEKKLVSEDSKGVTKKITALKYSTDTAAYDKSITEAQAAYDALTNKYKKKVKSSTVATLKAHEDAIKVIKEINALKTVDLLSAADAAAIDSGLVADIAKITGKDGSYTTLDKKAKGLVKNYKNIKAIEKLITTQKEYLKNNTKVKAFETALTAVTQSETVRTIDNQVKLGETTYKISVDKATKAIILTTKNEAATETKVELNATTTSITDYVLENAKGKLTISTALTDANKDKVVPIYDFKGMSLDAFIATDKKYTAEQKTAIEAAITAFEAANKDKIAKKHLNAADVTLVKKYQTALKQQVALEAKEEAKEYKDFTAAVGALKYSTEKGTDTNAAKSLYEVETTAALTTYQTLAGATAEEVGGEGAEAITAKYEDAKKKLAKTKTKLDDHVAASAVATSILALPALDEVKVDTDVSKARTAFDQLSATQKTLLAEGEKTLQAVEKQKTLLVDLAAAKTIVTKDTSITVESTKAKDKKVILAAIKALDTKDTKNTVITALTESSIDITEAGEVTVKLTAAEADKVTVTVNKNYDNELLAALNAKTVTVTPAAENAPTNAEVLEAINELDTVKGLDAAAKALITAEKLTYTAGATTATVKISDTLTATIKVVVSTK